MARHPSGNADLLRLALTSTWPAMRRAAYLIIAKALKSSPTRAQSAEQLGIGVRTLERIRADFPEQFGEF